MKKTYGSELLVIENLKHRLAKHAKITLEAETYLNGMPLPIYSFTLGSKDPKAPTMIFVGGVHGLEVIGTQVVCAYMQTLSHLLEWDHTVHDQLRNIKLIFYPCVNPGGIMAHTRSNPNGVDLMRNAPVEASAINPFWLVGGHRISPRLPWYRGPKGAPMEIEAQALCDFIKREAWQTPFSMVIDVHSGFGASDRIWFPFAREKKPFPRVAEVLHLKQLLDSTFPHHFYEMEPQSVQYRTHGDLWDYLYLQHEKEARSKTFIPLCLELGSWMWVKKNPSQILNALGIFNPILPHRKERTLRRHNTLFDFLLRATAAYKQWAVIEDKSRHDLEFEAFTLWYQEKQAS